MSSSFSPSLSRLIQTLRMLPGVGAKSAQRMAFELLDGDRNRGLQLAEAITSAMRDIGACSECRMWTEAERCDICASDTRDPARVCVVESPADVMALEANTGFDGRYFVLRGHLSPIDGIGPEELGLGLLRGRLANAAISELILAVGATVEGQATAEYVADLAQRFDTRVTRIAHGVPVGGELEMVDAGTLAQAFAGRRAW